MEKIKLKNGTVWPDPTGADYKTLAWRFRHAHDSVEPKDLFCAAEVMEAFETLITHPAFTLEEVKSRVSEIRKAIKKKHNKP